jgi:hypothetical protein
MDMENRSQVWSPRRTCFGLTCFGSCNIAFGWLEGHALLLLLMDIACCRIVMLWIYIFGKFCSSLVYIVYMCSVEILLCL